jgi:hypothetical protein
LRKSVLYTIFLFDGKFVSRHDGFGSKGFTEQSSRVERSETGTMIRRPIIKSERQAGSEGKSGGSQGELFSGYAELNAASCGGHKKSLVGSGGSAAAESAGTKSGNGFIV